MLLLWHRRQSAINSGFKFDMLRVSSLEAPNYFPTPSCLMPHRFTRRIYPFLSSNSTFRNATGEFPAFTRQPSFHNMRPAQWTHEHTHVVRRHSVSNLADYQLALGISGQEAALEAARRGMVAKNCGIRLFNDLRLWKWNFSSAKWDLSWEHFWSVFFIPSNGGHTVCLFLVCYSTGQVPACIK